MSFILDDFNTKLCACGMAHEFDSRVIVGSGAINALADVLYSLNAKRLFVLSDKNAFNAAGDAVCRVLEDFEVNLFVFDRDSLEPDESSVGLAVMHYCDCDAVIGVGSGVINDIGKMVAAISDKPYIIVGTAPSMDGYASATSSMTRDGLKISLNSKCACAIIGDTDILARAPLKMMASGIGDMLAKYVSICEWRISSLINNEHYCPEIAELVRISVKKCVDNASGLLKRDPKAVQAVFEGLVICGAAMKYAGSSRPASGVEHYISHIWDMRGAEFKLDTEFHGVQCAYGTLLAVRLYNKLAEVVPSREKALAYVSAFDKDSWHGELRALLGKGAQSMIKLEQKEDKYNKNAHRERLEKIIEAWDDILLIIKDELPSLHELENLMLTLGLPTKSDQAGANAPLDVTLKATKDIRDKYVLSRLLWDLGLLDEFADFLNRL